MEAAVERPHLGRECFQNAAYLRSSLCGLSWPWAIRSTSLCFACNSVKGTLQSSQSPGSKARSVPNLQRARPQTHPKRAHPARQAHQPLGPGTASHPPKRHPRAPGTEQPGRSLRRSTRRSQHPRSPPFRAPRKTRNTHGSGIGPQAEQVPHRSHRESRVGPSHTRQWSRGPTRLTVTTGTTVARLSSFNPQANHPWKPLHLVGAHPPCSRKGPHLPACGLKRPRRVKREATNSRFCGFSDSVKIRGHNPAPAPPVVGRRRGAPPLKKRSPTARGSVGQKGTAKPQHPGFPCGPPPWY